MRHTYHLPDGLILDVPDAPHVPAVGAEVQIDRFLYRVAGVRHVFTSADGRAGRELGTTTGVVVRLVNADE